MYEVLIGVFAIAFMYILLYLMPVIKHYRSYASERKSLEKRHNRLWRSRKDLMVSEIKTNCFRCILIGKLQGVKTLKTSKHLAERLKEWMEKWKRFRRKSVCLRREDGILMRLSRCQKLNLAGYESN